MTAFTCQYHPTVSPGKDPPQVLVINDTIVPDVIRVKDGNGVATGEMIMAGKWMSIGLMNTHPTKWLRDGQVEAIAERDASRGIEIAQEELTDGIWIDDIPPGGVRGLSIPIRLSDSSRRIRGDVLKWKLRVSYNNNTINATADGNMTIVDWAVDQAMTVNRKRVMNGAPHSFRYTFLGQTRDVQYAAVVVPKYACVPCKIVLAMHGAGVEAGKRAWTESYQRMKKGWVFLPSGRRPFGFDWHGPMMDNAWESVDAFDEGMFGIPSSLRPSIRRKWWGKTEVTGEDLLKLDRSQYVFSGHSMGGHSCFTFFTHYPDLALAGVCASGWLRLANYGGWWIRQSQSFADSKARAMLRQSLEEYSTDLYSRNVLGIPFVGRTGGKDESVPPWNMRKMVRLLKQEEYWAGVPRNQSVVQLSEVPGKRHWFGEVLNEASMQEFFSKSLEYGKPVLPKVFEFFTINPSSSGTRGGLRFLQLTVPFEGASLKVKRNDTNAEGSSSKMDSEWAITSVNVRRFRYSKVDGILPRPAAIRIDDSRSIDVRGTPVDFCLKHADSSTGSHGKKVWRRCRKAPGKFSNPSHRNLERRLDTQGPALRVLSNRAVHIVYPEDSLDAQGRAITLGNSLFSRGRYSVTLDSDTKENVRLLMGDLHRRRRKGEHRPKNLIILGGSNVNRVARALEEHGYTADVRFTSDSTFCVSLRCFQEPGIGIAFLAGLPNRALTFIVGGTDDAGYSRALSMLPTSSQKEIPDWTVLSKEAGWDYKGVGGILGFGYWNRKWRIDARSTYPSDFNGYGSVCSGSSQWRLRRGEYDGQFLGMSMLWIYLMGFVLLIVVLLKANQIYRQHGKGMLLMYSRVNAEEESSRPEAQNSKKHRHPVAVDEEEELLGDAKENRAS